MKKILGLGLVAILVMALVGGGTWAYFSDTESSTGNTLTVGTLDVGLANSSGGESGGSATATWVSPAAWKPGDNISGILYVKNSGTIDMNTVNITLSTAVTGGPAGTVSNPKVTSLGGQVSISANWSGAAVSGLDGSTLSSANGTSYNLGSLTAGQEKELWVNFVFSIGADNGCQGQTATVTATINGYQQ